MVRRAGLVFVLLPACVVAGVLVASVYADTPPPTATTTTATTAPDTTSTATTTPAPAMIPDGVVLGGVTVGGMTPDDAAQALVQRFSRPLVLRVGRLKVTVAPEELGVSVPTDAAVARALSGPSGATLGLRASVDVPALKSFVATLAARYDRKPVSSRLFLRHLVPVVSASKPGLVIEQGATLRALRTELAQGTRAPLDVPAKTPQPQVTESSFTSLIVIRRGSNLLSLYHGERLERQFHVATGQAIYPTPLGRFQIVVKWKNPWWYPPPDPWAKGEKPTPPGPGNPLGTRWMGISSPGVGIHGTPESGSIGYSLSHGCIRMLIPQAEWLFDHVDVGTPVFIVSA